MAHKDEQEIASIVLADDHEIVRAGIKRLLSIDKGLKIIDEASNGADAVDLVKYHKPDVAMIDILMPKMNGIEAARIIKESMPEVLVIMLTAFEDYMHVEQALSAGANAYLSKDISAQELVYSIRSVIKGERALSRSIINILQRRFTPDKGDEESPVLITKREQETLNLVANGMTSPDIARELNISVRTVESHRYNLMRKLGVSNTAGLVRYAVLHRDFLMNYRGNN